MRPRYKMVSWHPTSDRSKENEIRQRVMKNLTPQQIAANTTRRSTPGLINPLQGEAGGRIPHLALRNGQGQVRGSRPTRPKIIKKPNKSTRPDEAIDEEDEEHDEEDAEEQDKVHEEPQSEASPYPVSGSNFEVCQLKANQGIIFTSPQMTKLLAKLLLRLMAGNVFHLTILKLVLVRLTCLLLTTSLARSRWRKNMRQESVNGPSTPLLLPMMKKLWQLSTTYPEDG